jgi:hypothetical protein
MSAIRVDSYLRALHRRRTVLSLVLALAMILGYSGAIGMVYWRWAELDLSPLLVTWSRDGKYYASARGTVERWDHPSLKRIDKRTYELSDRATTLAMLLGFAATIGFMALGGLHIMTRHPYFDEETGKAGPYWKKRKRPTQPPPVPDPERRKRL